MSDFGEQSLQLASTILTRVLFGDYSHVQRVSGERKSGVLATNQTIRRCADGGVHRAALEPFKPSFHGSQIQALGKN